MGRYRDVDGIISASVVRPRTPTACCACNRYSSPGTPMMRLYGGCGSAPYILWQCIYCAGRTWNKDYWRALIRGAERRWGRRFTVRNLALWRRGLTIATPPEIRALGPRE